MHCCEQVEHWARDCPKVYNKVWLAVQQCFKCGQLGHFRRHCLFKITKEISNSSALNMRSITLSQTTGCGATPLLLYLK